MNNFLTEKELKALANTHDQHCVSVYLPTSKAGEEEKNRIRLKNNLKIIRSALQHYGLNKFEIDEYLSPADALLEETTFWRKQSNGLAIFLKDAQIQFYKLPYKPGEFRHISDHFYLKPLFTLFNNNQKFFVLNLSLQKIRLFETDLFKINEVKLDQQIPASLEEITGNENKEKSLQFRTGAGKGAPVIYHGHGAGKDEKQKETEKFFRAVDHGLIHQIGKNSFPLILACIESYRSLYANNSKYEHLLEKYVSGNHDESDLAAIHKLVLPIIKNHLKTQLQHKINQFKNSILTEKASIDLNEIIPAAFDGRIQYLFLNNQKEKYGLYDTVNRTLIVEEVWKTGHASLFNMAAVQTWLNGGEVFLIDADQMPVSGSGINALFRY